MLRSIILKNFAFFYERLSKNIKPVMLTVTAKYEFKKIKNYMK